LNDIDEPVLGKVMNLFKNEDMNPIINSGYWSMIGRKVDSRIAISHINLYRVRG